MYVAGNSVSLRATILNMLSNLITSFFSYNEQNSEMVSFIKSIQHPLPSLIQTSLDSVQSNLSGFEALFEPSLRLWVSMVEGPGSIWSVQLAQLMPILVGTNSNQKSLIERVDSAEEAEVFFYF